MSTGMYYKHNNNYNYNDKETNIVHLLNIIEFDNAYIIV